MNTEWRRFFFLVYRDGLEAALEFEKRGSDIYRFNMIQSLNQTLEESPTRVKGKEWAAILCQSARDCDSIVEKMT